MAKRRRKLRSLVPQESAQSASLKPERCRELQWPMYITFILLGVLIVWSDFLPTYRSQYNSIVHGDKDYCNPTIDTGKLFTEISAQVVNQPAALSSIEQQIRNDSKFTAIAVAGGSGVGKSLFAQALKDNFPWPESTQEYSWSSFAPDVQKKEKVLMFLNYLSDCGRNLIIIDNLGSEDVDFVQEFNTYSLKHVQQVKANLIIIYVFNVVTHTDEQREQYRDKIKAIKQLQNIKIIEFKKFRSDDIKNCIRHEARNLNLTLKDESFEEVLKSIDAERSGCKNVHSKVQVYGDIQTRGKNTDL